MWPVLQKTFLAAIIALTLGVPVFPQSSGRKVGDYERGRSEARRAVRKGRFVIKGWGLDAVKIGTVPTREEVYSKVLRDKYNIRLENNGACMTPESEADYIRGYNEVSLVAIKRKFGSQILETARVESDGIYYARYSALADAESRRFREAVLSLEHIGHR